jgi:hypothetical protein
MAGVMLDAGPGALELMEPQHESRNKSDSAAMEGFIIVLLPLIAYRFFVVSRSARVPEYAKFI